MARLGAGRGARGDAERGCDASAAHGRAVRQGDDLVYGVFDGEEHETVGRAMAMGAFVGSAWAVAAVVVWAVAGAVARGGLDGTARWVLSVVVAMLAGGILQQLWFNFRATARLSYAGRIAGFGLTYFAILAGCAALGSWLPAGNPWAWVSFAVLYLMVLAALTIVFTVAFRRRSEEYQRVLDGFRSRRR